VDPDLPPGLGGFLPGLLGDLLKLLKTDSPVQWELAFQLSQSIASEASDGSNPEPLARIRLEELARIAELQVGDVTGMTTTASGQPLRIAVAARGEWAHRRLEASKTLLEQIAGALAPAAGAVASEVSNDDDDAQDAAQLQQFMARWASAVAPAMIGMQFGSFFGHLATRTLGYYELPLPRDAGDEIIVVPENLAHFADDWSLPAEEVSLYFLVRDVTSHAILSRPHVGARLTELLVAHAAGFRPDPNALQQRLGQSGVEIGDLSQLTQFLGDPAALGEIVDTPEQRRVRAELTTLSAAILGYVEWVADSVGQRAIASRPQLREALRRRRVARSAEERSGESLIGIDLDQETIDRGEAFVRGVIERGGDSELAALFVREQNLPTPAEIDAPGLWIERVNLPPDDRAPDAA
jgi:putative hydrolase